MQDIGFGPPAVRRLAFKTSRLHVNPPKNLFLHAYMSTVKTSAATLR